MTMENCDRLKAYLGRSLSISGCSNVLALTTNILFVLFDQVCQCTKAMLHLQHSQPVKNHYPSTSDLSRLRSECNSISLRCPEKSSRELFTSLYRERIECTMSRIISLDNTRLIA